MSAPSVSVVIRCFNEERHIGRLLTGLQHQTHTDFETILVDSGSTDATLTIAARFPVEIVSIRPEEFSFGRSLNRGFAAARGAFVVVASAHTYPVYGDWLEQLTAPFADDEVGLVYGRQRGAGTTRYSERQIFAHWFPERSVARTGTPFCNNANAAVRRSLWEQFRYDEDLTGLEDLDFARRIVDAGWFVAYSAEAEVVHVHDETWKQIYNRYRREAIAFRRIFPQESFRVHDFLRHVASNVATDYYHAVREREWLGNLLTIPAFRLMQFGGTFSGYRHEGPISRSLRQTFYYPRSRDRSEPVVDRGRDRLVIPYAEIGEDVGTGQRA